MKRFAILILVYCLLIPVKADGQSSFVETMQTREMDPDATAIYAASAVELLHREPPLIHLKLANETDYLPVSDVKDLEIKGDRRFRKAWGGTLQAFVQASSSKSVVDRRSILSAVRDAFHDQSFESIDSNSAGAGVLSFSPVGFTRDHSKALVWASYFCGPLCGYGSYFFFQRVKGRWTLVQPKGASWSVLAS